MVTDRSQFPEAEAAPADADADVSEDETRLDGAGLTADERRACLIVVGCALFQEVDSSYFRAFLAASVVGFLLIRSCRWRIVK
ncbi:hypothetical protein ERJ75_000218200 [Trypanosoma vivax]|nr:hypothetical protein ERJ75_000218200 [Trypanosoma vivax]